MVSTDGRTDGQTDGRTDGRTDRRTDTEGYNIIPRHTLWRGIKMTKNTTASYVSCYRDCRGCREHSVNLALRVENHYFGWNGCTRFESYCKQ